MHTRSPAENLSVTVAIACASHNVHLPHWVNEALPDLRAILSAREISRLTRRPGWFLFGLSALGRFPKRLTHCGKPIGWHRTDILVWLTQNMTTAAQYPAAPCTDQRPGPSQSCSPLEVSWSSLMDHRSLQRLCRKCSIPATELIGATSHGLKAQ